MRIAYVGPFEHLWGTEEHVASAFEAMGHEVLRVPESEAAQGFQVGMEPAPLPDLLVYTKAAGLPSEASRVWRSIEEQGCATASFHLDLYRGLGREARVNASDPFWSTGTVFTADGGSQEFFTTRGINHQWLPPAVAHDETHEGTWQAKYDHDVVFVGSGAYHKEWPWRTTLLRLLSRRYGPRFRHYDHHPPIRGNDLNDLYATARVVVGDSLALPGHRNYFSDRYFETVGRGGFLLGPRVPGIEDFFTDGTHLALYDIGDMDALIDRIDFWLDHQIEARQIAQCGQAHVRANHTYVHRVEQMLSVLGLQVAA